MEPKDLTYWNGRYLDIKRAQLTKAKSYEKAFNSRIHETLQEIEKEVDKWCGKYANEDGTIDSLQAKKLLRGQELNEWKYSLAEWEQMAKDGSFEHEMNLEYYKSRVSRLKELEGQVAKIITITVNDEIPHLENLLKDTYQDTYYQTIFNRQMQTGRLSQNFNRLSENQLNAIVRSGWKGSNFSKRLWKNSTEKLPKVLTESLFRGMALGYNQQELVKLAHGRLKGYSGDDVHRLVVTESAHITEQATYAAYEESGVDKYEWIATLESHTCSIEYVINGKTYKGCSDLDGEVFEMGPNNFLPPLHPYCRCTTAPWDDLLDRIKFTRWARDPVTGKSVDTEAITFDEWKGSNEARIQLDKANNAEPAITKDMKEIAKLSGTNLEGLDFRLKTLDSLSRKLSNEPGTTMRDVVRYTAISDRENMTKDFYKFVDELENRGYNVSAVKNYWNNSSNPYNGINTNFFSPNKYEFEIQFHTKESFNLKNGKLHELYEKARIIDDKKSKEYIDLQDEMFDLSEALNKPKGIELIKDVK